MKYTCEKNECFFWEMFRDLVYDQVKTRRFLLGNEDIQCLSSAREKDFGGRANWSGDNKKFCILLKNSVFLQSREA